MTQRLHKPSSANLLRQQAFTLLELSISLAIIALLLSGALTLMSDFTVSKNAASADTDLQELTEAIIAFKDRNGRLPCPASHTVVYGSAEYGRQVNAGDCTYTVAPSGTTRVETEASSGVWILSGAVPVRDLLLRDAYLKDAFGNRFSYTVPQVLTDAATFDDGDGALTVVNRAGNEIISDGAFALVAHGSDGKGAYREGSGALKAACGASANLDVENCDGDATFTDAPFSDGSVEAAYFDDTVLWKSKVDIIDLDPAAPPEPDFTGFRADGVVAGNYTSVGSATGDINGDGFDDVIFGSVNTTSWGGYAYVVFGSAAGIPTPFDLLTLDGTNGFRLDGSAGSRAGWPSVSSGDINNDGFDDVIVGAWGENSLAGYTYVVFGKASGWAATTALSTVNGTTGFRLDGASANDRSGYWVSSGNINGDGFDDVIVGAHVANSGAGYTYVVFGKASGWAASTALSSLNGTTGFRLDGAANNDYSGERFAAGDINGDGFDDVIVVARSANSGAGYTYVVFGKASGWAASTALSSLNGTTGFRLDGTATGFSTPRPAASSDVNGDGFDDVIIGDTPVGGVGATFVVFGKASGWATSMVLNSTNLNGTTGFVLNGSGGNSGWAVAGGDVNGDGFGDVIVGADTSNSNAGYVYVVFGKASGWASTLALSSLDGSNGFRLTGSVAGDRVGYALSSGDITGDDRADIIIGAYLKNSLGSTYGVYGKSGAWSATYDLDTITVP